MERSNDLNYTDFFRWTVQETGQPEILNNAAAITEILIDYMTIRELSSTVCEREQKRLQRFLHSGANITLTNIGKNPGAQQKEQFEEVISRLRDVEDFPEAAAQAMCEGFWRAFFQEEPPTYAAEPLKPEFDIQNNILVKYNGSAANVVIPEGVVHIGKEAFANNRAVQYVTLPNSVYGLGKDCFLNCVNLREVNIPGNVATARLDWFAGCVNLDRLVMQPGVQKLHFGMKLGQLYAKQIEFPDSLTQVTFVTLNGDDQMEERLKHPKQVIASPQWIQEHQSFFQDMPDFSFPGQAAQVPEPVGHNQNTHYISEPPVENPPYNQTVQPVQTPHTHRCLLLLGNICAIGNGLVTLLCLFLALGDTTDAVVMASFMGGILLTFSLSLLRKNYLLIHGVKDLSFRNGLVQFIYGIWRYLDRFGVFVLACWTLMSPHFIMRYGINLRTAFTTIVWAATLVYHIWYFIIILKAKNK